MLLFFNFTSKKNLNLSCFWPQTGDERVKINGLILQICSTLLLSQTISLFIWSFLLKKNQRRPVLFWRHSSGLFCTFSIKCVVKLSKSFKKRKRKTLLGLWSVFPWATWPSVESRTETLLSFHHPVCENMDQNQRTQMIRAASSHSGPTQNLHL